MVKDWLVRCLLFVGLALTGCKASGIVGGECIRGLVACDGVCVNLGQDANHCGSCGRECASGFECRVGACLPEGEEPQPDPTAPVEGGAAMEAGAEPIPDASPTIPGGETDAPGPTAPTSDGGDEDPCFPPYNSAEHCGACNVSCGVEEPFCAPSRETFECVDGCPDSLRLCADRCVDVTRDPLHCGRCGAACPTGICQDGRCVGGSAGHVVALCMSFEQLFANSPQAVLLANAVFLATAPMTRVLLFQAYATPAARNGVRSVVLQASSSRGRPVSIDVVADPADIAGELDIAEYDVFLMADTSRAPAGALRDLGRSISTTLDTFVSAGGVVVIAHGANAGEMVDFWGNDGAGLFDFSGLHDITFTELQNRAPADALAANVLTPFLALSSTCAYEMAEASDPNQSVVITGLHPGDAGGELPVVVHRVSPAQP